MRLFVHSSAFAAALLASGCSGRVYDWKPGSLASTAVVGIPPDAMKIRIGGAVYRRLTGGQLRKAIVGRSMFIDPASGIVVSADGQFFYPDGKRYTRNRHRVGAVMGTYSVGDERVCTTVEVRHSCFALFKAEEGAFLIHSGGQNEVPTPVVLKAENPFAAG